MAMIKRYYIELDCCEDEIIFERDSGDWVLYEDVGSLLTENRVMRDALEYYGYVYERDGVSQRRAQQALACNNPTKRQYMTCPYCLVREGEEHGREIDLCPD